MTFWQSQTIKEPLAKNSLRTAEAFNMSLQSCFNKPNDSLWEVLHWHPSPSQLEQFVTLQKLLNQFNEQVNLTRLLKKDDYWVGQIIDSLWPLKNELNSPEKVLNCIDVGTGCGFPGLAVAISLPKAQLTLVDSTRKKTSILKTISTELGLNSRINILTQRIEATGHNLTYRGKFDLAMARAVADAPVTAEYLIPLIKPSGKAFLFKGRWNQIDEKELLKALAPLKAKINRVQRFELPLNRGTRHLICLEARSPCPTTYPRPIGIPNKRPLGFQEVDNLF